MLGALSALSESQKFSEKLPNSFTNPISEVQSILSVEVNDPLRELVLYSNNEDADPEKLKFLALSAANLVSDTDKSPHLTSKNMKVITGMFTGTGIFMKNVEENSSKKYSALEPSDSEGFGGNVISQSVIL